MIINILYKLFLLILILFYYKYYILFTVKCYNNKTLFCTLYLAIYIYLLFIYNIYLSISSILYILFSNNNQNNLVVVILAVIIIIINLAKLCGHANKHSKPSK